MVSRFGRPIRCGGESSRVRRLQAASNSVIGVIGVIGVIMGKAAWSVIAVRCRRYGRERRSSFVDRVRSARLRSGRSVTCRLLAVSVLCMAGLVIPTTAQASVTPATTYGPFYSRELRVTKTLIEAVDSHIASIGIYLT